MRTAARKDRNHNEIAALFVSLGWSVWDTSQLKNSADMVVARCGITIVVEVKDGLLAPSARKLTPGEQKFKDSWKGAYEIVEFPGDVLRISAALFPGRTLN